MVAAGQRGFFLDAHFINHLAHLVLTLGVQNHAFFQCFAGRFASDQHDTVHAGEIHMHLAAQLRVGQGRCFELDLDQVVVDEAADAAAVIGHADGCDCRRANCDGGAAG